MKAQVKIILLIAVALVGCLTPTRTVAATSAPTDATSLLTQLTAQFSNGVQFNSLQLSGTVTRHVGPTPDTGAATLTASVDGSNQVSLQLSNGTWKESQTATNSQRSCQWSGPDGIAHDSSSSTCWPPLVWFLPQISLNPVRPSPSLGTNYLGLQTTPSGTAYVVESQLIVSGGKTPVSVTSQIQKQSTTKLFVDPTTLFPAALRYKVLSDSGTATISVEVRFSEYRNLSGIVVPGHIERYLNGALELAIDVNQATILN